MIFSNELTDNSAMNNLRCWFYHTHFPFSHSKLYLYVYAYPSRKNVSEKRYKGKQLFLFTAL